MDEVSAVRVQILRELGRCPINVVKGSDYRVERLWPHLSGKVKKFSKEASSEVEGFLGPTR